MKAAALVCPGCGRAHEGDARFCDSCGLPLVHAPREAAPARTGAAADRARKVRSEYAQGEPVRVASARHQAEAELIQGLLIEEGIPSLVRRSGGFDVPDFLASGPRDVLVPASGVEAAREVLRAGAPGAAAAAPGSAPAAAASQPAAPRRGAPPWLRAFAVALALLLAAAATAGVFAAIH